MMRLRPSVVGKHTSSIWIAASFSSTAPGLTPRAVLEKLAAIQILDVCLPTTDGRSLIMPRYTEPEPDLALLLHQIKMTLPQQPPPRLHTPAATAEPALQM